MIKSLSFSRNVNVIILFVSLLLFGCQSVDKRIDEGSSIQISQSADVVSVNSASKDEDNKKEPTSDSKQSTAPTKISKITSEEFRSKIFDYQVNKEWKFAGSKPCIVDFYADWCGPCKMLNPILHKVYGQYGGKIDVYKVNIDEQREVASVFGVQSIPMLLFCPKSGQPQVSQGLLSESELKKIVDGVLLK